MAELYTNLLYKPLLNVLVFFYDTIAVGDLGIAIVLFTVFIRLLLFPIFHRLARNQLVMQRIQPELKKIQELHSKDREKQAEAMFALYKQHRINPFSNIFLVLVQLPVLIALYQIFTNITQLDLSNLLYSFTPHPSEIHTTLLNIIDLKKQSIVLLGFLAVSQYVQGKMGIPLLPKDRELSPAERIGRQMVFIGPVLTVAVFYTLPAAVSLYWFISTLLSIAQQHIISTQLSPWTPGNQSSKTS